MGIRKFKADKLFNGYAIMQGDPVLVTDSEGYVQDIVDIKDAGDGIEVLTGLLSPGFINAHCHLELSHLKGVIPTGTGVVDFVQQVMTKRAANDDAKLVAIEKAEQELYNCGTVAIGDICNTADTVAVKQKSKLHWHNFIEVSGFVDAAAEKRLQDAKNILDKFQNASLSPHAPYSVSKTLFSLLNEATNGQLITIHNQETAAENQLYIAKQGGFLELYTNFNIDISGFQPTGHSSLQSWLPYFTHDQSIILVHNTFTEIADINFARALKNKKYFCICINANKYIEKKIPQLDVLREKNSTIVIGTDSYASNWQLNILEEIKAIQVETANAIPLQELLQWATINGANALQMQTQLGSFEKGKRPGLVLIDKMEGEFVAANASAKRIL